jgi:acyl-coenzyme A thioesterase PaaI-like protein
LRAEPEFPDLEYGPEFLFGVKSLERFGDEVRGEVTHAATVGEIGVLIDDVMGHAMLGSGPAGHWAVTTEIAMDVVAVGPWNPWTPVRARGQRMQATSTESFALGTVTTPTGDVLAHCRQRGRFVPLTGDLYQPPAAPPIQEGHRHQAYGLIDIDDLVVETTATAELCNPLGNLHGGVTLAISEALASRPDATRKRRTTSIHVAYARPIPRNTVIRFHVERIHQGRSLAVSHVISRTLSGKPCTVATVVQA